MPTSFMRWQGKSVQFEELALVPGKIMFISGQCDTTGQLDLSRACVDGASVPSPRGAHTRAPTPRTAENSAASATSSRTAKESR